MTKITRKRGETKMDFVNRLTEQELEDYCEARAKNNPRLRDC